MRLRRVVFRRNRSTIWSLTRGGSALNLHEAFRSAPAPLLDAFAVIIQERGVGSAAARRASARIRSWPELKRALDAARCGGVDAAVCGGETPPAPARCCGTEGQRRYLRALYRYLNATRFGGVLPDGVPLRLSRQMRSRLGHMLPARLRGQRRVAEIALNVDLMLEGNGAERLDTLLHEMAHAADFLQHGSVGHGATWKAWARRVGCVPEATYRRPVQTRKRRRDAVTRVPPLPPALARLRD